MPKIACLSGGRQSSKFNEDAVAPRGRRAGAAAARKYKDYIAGHAKLVKVACVEKYRLCKVAEDGRRVEFEELVCRDDGHAVYLAKRLVLDHDVEGWNGNRFVFRLEC
jgi:hypothetical protein